MNISARDVNVNVNENIYFPVTLEGKEGCRGGEGDVLHLALELADALRDWRSMSFFRRVAATIPESIVREALSQVLETPDEEIIRSRAAYFTWLMRKHMRSARAETSCDSGSSAAPREDRRAWSFPGDDGASCRDRGGREERELLASFLADRLCDAKSLALYLRIARALPESLVRDCLSRALDLPAREVKRSRAAYFTALCLPHLREHEAAANRSHQT